MPPVSINDLDPNIVQGLDPEGSKSTGCSNGRRSNLTGPGI